jgi:aminoglycoside phosphotransferase (APT) family kinase protein
VVLQNTNNVVMHLVPHRVVAKVGVWDHSAEVLAREVAVCRVLAEADAPVAHPIGELTVDEPSGLPVSLWVYLESMLRPVAAHELAMMLAPVHEALGPVSAGWPPFWAAVDSARSTLFDDRRMTAVGRGDLAFLRAAFVECEADARSMDTVDVALHGEPHLGNIVVTERGPRLIDFEAASIGPIEWDLASLDPAVAREYPADVDLRLLGALRRLNSARVATWSWALSHLGDMRRHAEHHLALLRQGGV